MTLIERLRYLADNMPDDTAELLRAAIARIEAADKALEFAVCRCESGPEDCPAMIYSALVREQDGKDA